MPQILQKINVKKIIHGVIHGFEYVQKCELRWRDRRYEVSSGRPNDDSELSKHRALVLVDVVYGIS